MDNERAPAEPRERIEVRGVAGAIAGDFSPPIIRVLARRPVSARAIVAVPEAAVHEDGELFPAVDDIRLARQIGAMQAVAGRDLAEKLADGELRGRVARFYGAHGGGAFGGGHGFRIGSIQCAARWRTIGATTPSPSR